MLSDDINNMDCFFDMSEEEKKYKMFSPGLIACMQECGSDVEVIPAICIAVCPCNRIKKPNLPEDQLRALKAIVKLYIEKINKTAAQEIYGNVPEQPTTNKGQNTDSTGCKDLEHHALMLISLPLC